MSVLPGDLVFYGSFHMPTTDGALTGGTVLFSTQITFADMAVAGTVNYVSDSGLDTGQISTSGLDGAGVNRGEFITLTGVTIVTGSQIFAQLLGVNLPFGPGNGNIAAISTTAVVSGTAQTGSANAVSVTPALFKLAAGQGAGVNLEQVIHTTGGTGPNQLAKIIAITGYGVDVVAVDANWTIVPDATTTYTVNEGALLRKLPNACTIVRRPFQGIYADAPGGVTRTFYEKIFVVNNNTTTALTVASIIKQVDPVGALVMEFALNATLNDVGTVATRQTTPVASLSAFSVGAAPQTLVVIGAGNLPNGAAPNTAGAQGIWLSGQLAAGSVPGATSFTLRVTGQTI